MRKMYANTNLQVAVSSDVQLEKPKHYTQAKTELSSDRCATLLYEAAKKRWKSLIFYISVTEMTCDANLQTILPGV